VINSSGNVGIGISSHTIYTLDVNGDINLSTGCQFRLAGSVSSDLIGGNSSNYSDEVGLWGSNYVLTWQQVIF